MAESTGNRQTRFQLLKGGTRILIEEEMREDAHFKRKKNCSTRGKKTRLDGWK